MFREIIVLAVARLEGHLEMKIAVQRLRQRDRRLRLEFDSFNQLSVFADELVELFPRAKFLLTVREPRSWLRSIINQHLNVDVSNREPERRLRKLFFGSSGCTFSNGEKELERHGLFSLDGYLKGWSEHYERVLAAVPRERLLILRTEDLATSVGRLASFLSIPRESINQDRSHLHRCSHDHGVFDRLEGAMVEEKVKANCDAVLMRIGEAIERQPW